MNGGLTISSLKESGYEAIFVGIGKYQSMSGDTCDRTCSRPRTCKISSSSEKSPMPTSLSTIQLHMPNRNFFGATATLVTVNFCCHSRALTCFILNETFDLLH